MMPKFSAVLLPLALCVATAQAKLVARQTTPASTCVPSCYSTLYASACPDATDAACLCLQPHFGVDMYLCMSTFCDASDLDAAVQGVEDVCKNAAYPVSLGPADGLSTSSTSTSSTSTSVSASVTSKTTSSPATSPTKGSSNPTTQSSPTPSKGSAAIMASDKWALLWIIGGMAFAM